MFKFQNNHIITGYIKELLYSFNLPIFKVWKPNDFIVKDNFYLYNNIIYLATKSGTFSELNDTNTKYVKRYLYDDYIANLTTNMVIRSNLYDIETHKYFGNYLRFLRDYSGLDLMSLYNCFSTETPKQLNLTTQDETIKFTTSDTKHIIYMVPVKFNQKYTIALSCHSKIEIVCGFYNKNNQLNLDIEDFIGKTHKTINSPSFNEPILYTNLLLDKLGSDLMSKLYKYENTLYMFIKLPIHTQTTITVIEGSYLNINNHFPTKIVYPKLDKINNTHYPSNMQLLSINTGTSYPFADRLVEYIIGNTIDCTEKISKNIKYLQQKLVKQYNNYCNCIKDSGIWTNDLQYLLYNIAQDKNLNTSKYDILGYVDKDVEYALGNINYDKNYVRYNK